MWSDALTISTYKYYSLIKRENNNFCSRSNVKKIILIEMFRTIQNYSIIP